MKKFIVKLSIAAVLAFGAVGAIQAGVTSVKAEQHLDVGGEYTTFGPGGNGGGGGNTVSK